MTNQTPYTRAAKGGRVLVLTLTSERGAGRYDNDADAAAPRDASDTARGSAEWLALLPDGEG